MTPLQPIGAMSSSRVILGELLSSRARLRFPGQAQAQPSTPVRQVNLSERHTGLFQTVSLKGFTPVSIEVPTPRSAEFLKSTRLYAEFSRPKSFFRSNPHLNT
jgi:hypothetical protein